MIYVFTVLYALAWGLAGYFTVKFVCARIEKKRAEDAIVKLMLERQKLEGLAQTGRYEVIDLNTIDR